MLRLLRYRHKLVRLRARAKNSLQAVAFSAGSSGRSWLLSREGRRQFVQLPMSEAKSRQRDGWLSLIDYFNARLKNISQTEHSRGRVRLQSP